MTIQPILPDVASPAAAATPSPSAAGSFARALDAVGDVLTRADHAESAFVHGRGGLQEMVVERARADVALQIATTAVSKATQAISNVMGMQI